MMQVNGHMLEIKKMHNILTVLMQLRSIDPRAEVFTDVRLQLLQPAKVTQTGPASSSQAATKTIQLIFKDPNLKAITVEAGMKESIGKLKEKALAHLKMTKTVRGSLRVYYRGKEVSSQSTPNSLKLVDGCELFIRVAGIGGAKVIRGHGKTISSKTIKLQEIVGQNEGLR